MRIVFFGLGAVGSNMLNCLAELAERDGLPVHFALQTLAMMTTFERRVGCSVGGADQVGARRLRL